MISVKTILSLLQTKSVTKAADGTLTIETSTGTIEGVDCLLWAIGRVPNIEIGLDKVVGEAHLGS